MPDAFDEAVLAAGNRIGQRIIEPPLAFELLAEQRFGRAARHRLLEGGYIQVPLWLSQDELAELIDEVRSALLTRRDNEPAPGRSPYLVSPILFPLGEPARRVSRTDVAEPSS